MFQSVEVAMKQYIIKGGTPLLGEVTIGGAKNAALGIIVAAIMADEPVTIDNLPDVDDVRVLLDAIESIGAIVERIDSHTVRINGACINDVPRIKFSNRVSTLSSR